MVRSNNGNTRIVISIIIPLAQILLHYYGHYQYFFAYGITISDLPKFDVNKLSISEFDSIYLNKRPVILTGKTICPSSITLNWTSIRQYCKGSFPGNFIHTKEDISKSKMKHWAGLQAGDHKTNVDFVEWVESTMGSRKNEQYEDENNKTMNENTIRKEKLSPRFLFDVPIVELCPTLLQHVNIPRHLVNVFESQFKYRHLLNLNPMNIENKEDEGADGLCTDLPFYNMYLAEKGFPSDMHIDSSHSSFIASMCIGRKRWRVITNEDFKLAYSYMGQGGRLVSTHSVTSSSSQDTNKNRSPEMTAANAPTWVLSHVRRPFDTWSSDNESSPLFSIPDKITMYEGILEPGELLYIPGGAPHAALTLEDSFMIASNDRTMQNLEEAVAYCNDIEEEDIPKSQGEYSQKDMKETYLNDQYQNLLYLCPEFRRGYTMMKDNSNDNESSIAREDTTLIGSLGGCNKTFELLLEVDKEAKNIDVAYDEDSNNYDESPGSIQIRKRKKLIITPENFRSEIERNGGHMVILKSQTNCGPCLFLMKHWEELSQGFTPPIRFGILETFQGQCAYGDDPLYKDLLNIVNGRPCPDFIYISMIGDASNKNRENRNDGTIQLRSNSIRSSFQENDEKHNEEYKTPKRLHWSSYNNMFLSSLSLTDIQIWASVHTGSNVIVNKPLSSRLVWRSYHIAARILLALVETIGPIGIGILVGMVMLALLIGWDYIDSRGSINGCNSMKNKSNFSAVCGSCRRNSNRNDKLKKKN